MHPNRCRPTVKKDRKSQNQRIKTRKLGKKVMLAKKCFIVDNDDFIYFYQ